RCAPPTGVEPERRLGELDGGHAVLFASGTGAVTALALAFLAPDQTIALAQGAYFGTGVTFAELAGWGLRHVEFDQTGPPPDGVDLIWLEAPSNPFLTMPDLEAAVAHPAPVVVDATAATPIHLRPLEHGADFVLHSATKYLAGHDDALLRAIVCKRKEAAARLQAFPTRLGGVDSLLESRARWEGDRVPLGLLRLSVGLEPVEDLWDDLARALEIPGSLLHA